MTGRFAPRLNQRRRADIIVYLENRQSELLAYLPLKAGGISLKISCSSRCGVLHLQLGLGLIHRSLQETKGTISVGSSDDQALYKFNSDTAEVE